MQNSVTQFTQMFPPLIPQLHDVDIDSPGNWLLPIHAKSLKSMLLHILITQSVLCNQLLMGTKVRMYDKF